MQAPLEITVWHWVGFIVVILLFLALDLGVFHRKAHVVRYKEALAWTFVWFSMAMCFAGSLAYFRGRQEAVQFVTGYILELSLSMDNVFVIALIFGYFRVPQNYQHRVLFWGILGALVMRGVMILLGTTVVKQFEWMLYVFGAFLLVSGIKMAVTEEEGVHPEKNPVLRLARKLFPISTDYEGQKFITRVDGRFALTPLAMVLLMVETTDLVFALDSIPAIFGVTQEEFIIFTSNVFAILGLRSLYFVLAGAIGYFRFLKVGLSLVLVFIGIKMLIDPHAGASQAMLPAGATPHEPLWFQLEISAGVSLAVVGGIILVSILLSWIGNWRERQAARLQPPPGT